MTNKPRQLDLTRPLHACFVALLALAVAGGCGGDSGSAGAKAGDPNSSELLDRSYGYLIKGDPDFARFAPNYSTLRPFTRDTAMVVESKSEREHIANPPSDYKEYFHIRIRRPMTVRMVVADSSGNGLITYEFPGLQNGDYTIGSKGWPRPQSVINGNPFIWVYFVGDQRFRYRYKLGLDVDNHLTYMPQPPPVG